MKYDLFNTGIEAVQAEFEHSTDCEYRIKELESKLSACEQKLVEAVRTVGNLEVALDVTTDDRDGYHLMYCEQKDYAQVFEGQVKELEQKLAEAEYKLGIACVALEFYGNKKNWRDNDVLGYEPSICSDTEMGGPGSTMPEESDHLTVGGKRARQALKEIKAPSANGG